MENIEDVLQDLINEGNTVLEIAINNNGNYSGIYYNGIEYESWISKCELIIEKYYKNTCLEEKFKKASKIAVGNGREYFDTMIGILNALKTTEPIINNKIITKKQRKIFISHCSKDRPITDKLVDLIKGMGVNNEQIYYSSYDETGANLLQDCLESIKNEFDKYDLMIIFVLSPNFYNSKVCIAETGATWVVVDNKYIPIILPPYNFDDVKGVIKSTQNGILLANNEVSIKLENLKEKIESFLEIKNKISSTEWNRKKEYFIEYINKEFKKMNEVESYIDDLKINDKKILVKIKAKNNLKVRLRLEDIRIKIKHDANEIDIFKEGWLINSIVLQPLEELVFYIEYNVKDDVKNDVKKSKIKLKESSIELNYYEEK
ncbi:toll/interleukin-1 receptor domain-containing protein [Clostridium perfringens]|uniref:toll/interleukin-1 receptor domain-containing protein n=1 Tax=Clostridium perfringens TaxID=1502 RepID=UPI00290A7928|nr:toll/interleukin-1 receptor domain-containing protein [Clostridium perfringens]EJT6171155.1 TIR domain-containing protein [Clostridium perfringens]EJT6541881.1 TIR domain-containing protein [Clostridium perfringens]EJT6566888.1 TIR domain-containing protein [Clostridium perfringens]MBS5994378.1 TIR domain-containing protein [Clostridium perfringens]MDM0997462.1 toll/interleukin-1 receptor domain-containing protein [Clostridium perfringens]